MAEETELTPEQIREKAINDRMTESRGGLNRQQAEVAVDHQIENDKLKAAEAKAAGAKAAKK